MLVPGGAPAQEKLNLILNWVPTADHSPYFYARSQGWYQKAGIDLTIEFGKGSALSAQKVGAGISEFGVSDLATSLVAKSKGANLQAVMIVYANSPQGFYWLKSTGIAGPKDFPGKKIGNPPGDAARAERDRLAHEVANAVVGAAGGYHEQSGRRIHRGDYAEIGGLSSDPCKSLVGDFALHQAQFDRARLQEPNILFAARGVTGHYLEGGIGRSDCFGESGAIDRKSSARRGCAKCYDVSRNRGRNVHVCRRRDRQSLRSVGPHGSTVRREATGRPPRHHPCLLRVLS
jgi:hypothetical protein